MVWPGWDSLESVKKYSSLSEGTAIVLLLMAVLFELIALFWEKREKLFALLGLAALVLLAADEYVVNQYNHRKDALYEQSEIDIREGFTQKLQKAVTDAQDADAKASGFSDKLKKANDDAKDARNKAVLAEAQAEEVRQANAYRTLSPQQKETLLTALKAAGPETLYFICSPDPESQQYFSELSGVLTSAGWKLEMHPYNWGTIETYPSGVQVWVSDPNDAPRGAAMLQAALKKVDVDAQGLKFFMMKKDNFTLYVGPKPHGKTTAPVSPHH
jgi:hypothetical protein